MKNQWLIWVSVGVVIILVLFAFNYQGSKKASLSEIFPDEKTETLSSIQYVFVNSTMEKAPEVPQSAVGVKTSMTISAEGQGTPAVSPAALAKKTAVSSSTKSTTSSVKKTSSSSETTNSPKARFTIQIASYKDKNVADVGLKKLNAAGHSAYLVTRDLGEKGTWYRLYVGVFSTKAEADAYLSKIKVDYKGSFVISPK